MLSGCCGPPACRSCGPRALVEPLGSHYWCLWGRSLRPSGRASGALAVSSLEHSEEPEPKREKCWLVWHDLAQIAWRWLCRAWPLSPPSSMSAKPASFCLSRHVQARLRSGTQNPLPAGLVPPATAALSIAGLSPAVGVPLQESLLKNNCQPQGLLVTSLARGARRRVLRSGSGVAPARPTLIKGQCIMDQ